MAQLANKSDKNSLILVASNELDSIEFNNIKKTDSNVTVINLDNIEWNNKIFELSAHDIINNIINQKFSKLLPLSIQEATDNWRINNDLINNYINNQIYAFVSDNIEFVPNYFITKEDFRDVFNTYLSERGNSNLSHKMIFDKFTNHDLYSKNKLFERNKQRILKDYTHSIWHNGYDTRPKKEVGERSSYIVGIKFKE